MKKIISYCILLILIPAVVVGGALLFRDRQYAWVSLCVTLLSCVPVFLHFERSGADAKPDGSARVHDCPLGAGQNPVRYDPRV